MEVNKEKIQYVLQFCFDKGKNACQAAEIVNDVYGPDTVTANYAQFWFRQFCSGNFDVKDAPCVGRPVIVNVDKIMVMIEVDRHVSSHSITRELKIDNKTVLNHLHKAGFKKKLDVWVPHELAQKDMMDRISICEALAKWNEIDPFLKWMVTEDEKWVTYDNVRKQSWSKSDEAAQTVAEPGITARKVLLCIWWDWKGIIYYELLPYGQTLNLDLYCQQLDCLKLAIDQKRPELANRRGVVFHQDNARPHTSIVTRKKLRELGWEVLIHPPYSQDLAPSDYHLFLSLQNFFSDKKIGIKRRL
ncbi:histone-lysine N-methyltransferase SETMAR-like [Centruroides vittatus]|uniref:histone-lysine N-methyltransferase SETMAR-like n=1 Tax=Centruroides vittatus TaxID=120091 RepID=UPI00350F22E1